jgi:hypothetical protein
MHKLAPFFAAASFRSRMLQQNDLLCVFLGETASIGVIYTHAARMIKYSMHRLLVMSVSSCEVSLVINERHSIL